MAELLSNRYVPGAPGTYVNERAGVVGTPASGRHDTIYVMLEAPSAASTTRFPFNTPIAVTSLADYRALIGGTVPTDRIPLLAYKWVEVFFRNSGGGGDLRVIRVGTPNIISEVEILPSATKVNESGIPSSLQAGDVVYIQMTLNGNRLVSGEGEASFTADGEYLGVPVTIPADYIEGDASNNRLVSSAIANAMADAISGNPNLRSSVYVRDHGKTVDLNPESDSETAYVVVSGATFDSSISVVPLATPVGANYVLATNAYEISQANGQQANIVRVPQDYIQCIDTALEGQIDQGYLFAPTAFGQFDAEGRAAVGQAMATAIQAPSLRWAAVVDSGPHLVTDINKYRTFVPHKAANDLLQGRSYLVDNGIYEWTGESATFPKAPYQKILVGSSPKPAIAQSTLPSVEPRERIGLIDNPEYTVYSPTATSYGKLAVDTGNHWPVGLRVQSVRVTGNDGELNPFAGLDEAFVVAPPYDSLVSEYPDNVVFLAPNASSASSVYDYVVTLGGSKNVTQLPPGAINIPASAQVYSAVLSYQDNQYDLEVMINGQTSDLIENIGNRSYGINTQHLPATLQDPTQTFNLGMFSRVFNNPSLTGASAGGVRRGGPGSDYENAAIFNCASHKLVNGAKIYFNRAIQTSAGRFLVSATTRRAQNPYYVRMVDENNFVISASLTNFSAGSYVSLASTDTVSTVTPVIAYSGVVAGRDDSLSSDLSEVTNLALLRARKYGLDSSSIYNQVSPSSSAPSNDSKSLGLSVGINRSSSILGEGTVSPIGETPNAGYLPALELLTPPVPASDLAVLYGNNGAITGIDPAYVTRDGSGLATAITPGAIEPGAQGYWNVIGEAIMFVPPVWIQNQGTAATLTWEWEVDGVAVGALDDKVGVLTSALSLTAGDIVTVTWTLDDGVDTVTETTPGTAAFVAASSLTAEDYTIAGANQAKILNSADPYYVGRVLSYAAASLTDSGSGTAITSRSTQVFDYAGNALSPVGSDTQSVALRAADSGFFQLPGSTNGTYASIKTTIVVNAVNLVNTVHTQTPIGPLQAFAVSTWANNAITVPDSWQLSVAGLDVSYFGAQNYLCIPTVKQSFETEAYLVPHFPAFEGGTYSASGNLTGGVISGSYANLNGLVGSSSLPTSQEALSPLVGVYLEVTATGSLPAGAGGATVNTGEFIVVAENNGTFSWQIAKTAEDLSSYSVPMWGSNVKVSYRNEETPPSHLWRFDAITPLELIEEGLRGINSNGIPQTAFVERGVDSPSALLEDSQRYFDAQGFISFDGPWIVRVGGDAIPMSAYRAGVLVKSMRERGLHLPAAGTRYSLTDAVRPQIDINSSHQNTMNLKGCNVARTLPGYPQNTVFIWGARNRVNEGDGDQAQYRFMNTRVIMNVAYGILRSAFDSQIFTVAEGFNVLADKVVSTGNAALYPLYSGGVLFGDRPREAFQVICDARINDFTNLEEGIVFVEAFVSPAPTLERISVGLVRVAIGQMSETLEASGLSSSNV